MRRSKTFKRGARVDTVGDEVTLRSSDYNVESCGSQAMLDFLLWSIQIPSEGTSWKKGFGGGGGIFNVDILVGRKHKAAQQIKYVDMHLRFPWRRLYLASHICSHLYLMLSTVCPCSP
jgi:hypothetical protein